MAASPIHARQADLFRGLRFWTEPGGKLRLEGTVALAARYTGLAPRTIHSYIEDGEIASRQPGRHRADGDRLTATGRRPNYKCLVDMRDVFRLAYGAAAAAEVCRQLGVEPKPAPRRGG